MSESTSLFLQTQRDQRTFRRAAGLLQMLSDLIFYTLDDLEHPLAPEDAKRVCEYCETTVSYLSEDMAAREKEIVALSFGGSEENFSSGGSCKTPVCPAYKA